MRKIISREQKDKKIKRNQLIIGIILIAVMVFGTLGYAFSGRGEKNSEKIEYKGIEFTQDDSGYWRFSTQGYDFITKYNPKETEDIYFFIYLGLADYVNKPLYIVSESQEPIFEVSRNLNPFILRINKACLSEENCEKDFPIKNCSIDNIIIIQEIENENKGKTKGIYQEENCVFITVDFGNQTRHIDAFLFRVLGIN